MSVLLLIVAGMSTPPSVIAGRDIRLADVVPFETLRRHRLTGAASRVVARLPAERREVLLSREALVSLVRRRVPRLSAAALSGIAARRFTVAPQQRREAARVSLTPVDVAKGDTLILTARSGPVRIARPVVAMQPGRTGGRLFVRDSEGQVFPVRLETSETRR